MPSSEYTSHGGGALKLKGSKPAGIEKKRKKKKASTGIASEEQSPLSKNPVNNPDNQDESEGRNENTAFAEDDSDIAKKGDAPEAQPVIKTKAEREQEERRRKRVSTHVQYVWSQ